MKSTSAILSQKNLVLIFTYAPAGLGHLRVTDALYTGLPPEVSPLLVGSQDTGIKGIHRILSIHPVLRNLFEWGQNGLQQYIFTDIYRWILRLRLGLIYQQMGTVLDQRIETPETVLVVATHFALAHELAAIKDRIEKEKKVRMILVVQVTDDSPQPVWFVPNADLIFVPSTRTKNKLIEHGKSKGLVLPRFEVVPYPISPLLKDSLSTVEFHEREHQLDVESKSLIHVAIPISGAAVGLEYTTRLVDNLYKKSHRFMFHIVTRSAPYTLLFLKEMIERPGAKLYVSAEDREVVNNYEDVYKRYQISLEVTKPSEQCFKALFTPRQRGGSILLLSSPVGRQEYDNVDFLRRHKLIPSVTENTFLWDRARTNGTLKTGKGPEILAQSILWRGLELPDSPDEASHFIWWCMKEGLLYKMASQYTKERDTNQDEGEMEPTGVKQFWDKVAEFLTEDTLTA